MIKSFSLRNRFLALLCCAVISLFACSSEKSASHEDKCKSSVAECLTDGSWELERIEDANSSYAASAITDVRGTLTFKANGEYSFENVKVMNRQFEHYGLWTLNGETINVDRTAADGVQDIAINGSKVTLSEGGMVLKIQAPQGSRTPFADQNVDTYSMPSPVEKYSFRQ
jgi:hypothetical protein